MRFDRHLCIIAILLTGSLESAHAQETTGPRHRVHYCAGYKQGCTNSVDTRFGSVTLTVIDHSQYVVQVNGTRAGQIGAYSIDSLDKYSLTNSDVVLIAINTGGTACADEMYLVEVSSDSKFVLSDEFGTCDAGYKAHVEGDVLVIEMGAYFNPEHLKDLSPAERKAVEARKGTVYRWTHSTFASNPGSN